jgi:phytoene desaturase
MPDPAEEFRPFPHSACVIGAGLGGLALAIRLQAGGVSTTLVEAHATPGGCARTVERAGFRFDTGPGLVGDPRALIELWALSGGDIVDDVELLRVEPFCRYHWPDGSTFDHGSDEAALTREVARIAPGDAAGFQEFQTWCAEAHEQAWLKLGRNPLSSVRDIVRAAPPLAQLRAWRSVHAVVSRFVKSDKLREALSLPVLMAGGNPLTASAAHLLTHRLLHKDGLWRVKGGMGELAAAMARHFERIGGTLRLKDAVVRIDTLGDRVSEIETLRGWTGRFDAVASNADAVHTYRELLANTPRGGERARSLARKDHSPGMFSVHFGLEGTWPGIPHAMVLFPQRFGGLFDDIFEHGVLPRDQLIFLTHSTVTDPSAAPAGKSTFTAQVPVPNLGKLPLDWEQLGVLMEQRVLAEIGRRLIPDLDDRIVTKFHRTPRDHALEFNAHLGSAFGLEASFLQSGWLRPNNRDSKLRNFYLVGANTHPGAGIPRVIASARVTATLMLENMK